jgi:hypothetical protein
MNWVWVFLPSPLEGEGDVIDVDIAKPGLGFD